jgi:hypothetical protein
VQFDRICGTFVPMRRSRAHVAACAVALLVLGQLLGFAHEASTRHVTCGEHGEQLDAATLVEQLHACDQDHLVGVETDHGGDHADCAIARALHQTTQTSRIALPPQLVPVAAAHDALALATVAHTSALYLIAPKTSPPARLRTLFA